MTNQNRYDRNEDRWHFFLCRCVREVSVEVIIRISSQLWECGTHWADAESRWQRVLREYDLLNTSVREQGRKSAHGDRHFNRFACHRCKPLSFLSWLLGTESQDGGYVVWAGKMGRILRYCQGAVSLQLPFNNTKLMQANKVGGVSSTSWIQKQNGNNADVKTNIRTRLHYSGLSQLQSMLISVSVNCMRFWARGSGFSKHLHMRTQERASEKERQEHVWLQNANKEVVQLLKNKGVKCVAWCLCWWEGM